MRRTKFLDLYIEPARLLLYALHPVISAEAQLDRSTRCFPLTIGETMIFNLQTVSYHPLLLLLYIWYYMIYTTVTMALEEVFTSHFCWATSRAKFARNILQHWTV